VSGKTKKVSGVRLQVSAPPLAAEVTSLIGKEGFSVQVSGRKLKANTRLPFIVRWVGVIIDL